MRRLLCFISLAAALFITTAATAARAFWPPWLSIESPVNPADRSARDAVFLVHAETHDGPSTVSALSGSAEGLVAGKRRSVSLKIDDIGRPGVFAVRRQWPIEGTWLVRVTLESTTALVSLAPDGSVAAVRIPTTMAEGRPIPRAVVARDIDSTLMVASAR